jgi:hypothetical protein
MCCPRALRVAALMQRPKWILPFSDSTNGVTGIGWTPHCVRCKGGVAQLAEQVNHNHRAGGSNPSAATNYRTSDARPQGFAMSGGLRRGFVGAFGASAWSSPSAARILAPQKFGALEPSPLENGEGSTMRSTFHCSHARAVGAVAWSLRMKALGQASPSTAPSANDGRSRP